MTHYLNTRWIPSFAIALMLSLSFMPCWAKEPLNKVVAIVNNAIITQQDLQDRIESANKQNIRIAPKEGLEELIVEELQLQRAAQMGANINEAAMDKMLAHIAQQNHMTLPQLFSAIQAEGLKVDDYKKSLKNQQLIAFVRQKEILDSIHVTEQEVNQFLSSATHMAQLQNAQSSQYRIAHLLIPLSPAPTPEALKGARQQAQAILEKLKTGQAVSLTDLGWKKTQELPTLFVNIVPSLKKQEVFGPIQSESGLHIIQLIDKHEPHSALSKDTVAQKEHIKQIIKNKKASEKMAVWLQKLKSEAYVQSYLDPKES